MWTRDAYLVARVWLICFAVLDFETTTRWLADTVSILPNFGTTTFVPFDLHTAALGRACGFWATLEPDHR